MFLSTWSKRFFFFVSVFYWWLLTGSFYWRCHFLCLSWFLRLLSTLDWRISCNFCWWCCYTLSRRKWTWLRTRILLLLLEFVQLSSLQTTAYVFLRFSMVVYYLLREINSVFDWHYPRQRFLCCFIIFTIWSTDKPIWIQMLLITPFQYFFILFLFMHISVLDDLAHLSIQEGISDYHFFILEFFLESFAFEGKVVKIER